MKLEKLEKGHTYHIYNRGINGDDIFQHEDNYYYFLKLLEKHLANHIMLYAYCLMRNHYHLIVKIDSETKVVTQKFSNFFNAYAKGYNKAYNRTGSLFEKHFRRKDIKDEIYLKNLIIYTHKNPENHKVVKDFSKYKFSSYQKYLTGSGNSYILDLFNDKENFINCHGKKITMENSDFLDIKNTLGQDLQGSQNLAGHTSYKDQFYRYIQQLQDTITSKIEALDGTAKFQEDLWKRPEGGGGRTRVIENGAVFEKGGVNISAVHGTLPPAMQAYFKVKDCDFFACGLSLVLHPKNPFVPTVHANWRYFEMYDQSGTIVDQWFGGGQDLTPYYLFEEDAKHFHQTCKTACDKHDPEFYPIYKAKCDEYFYNTHRGEGRGLGGLFFDYCKATDTFSMKDWYNFVTEVGDSFLSAYVPIVERRKEMSYTSENRDWQEIRRGRYVEFNLVHDKGTLFGLKTNGRIESILMSLPPHVQWRYDHQPAAGSEEAKLLEVLKNPKDWV